MPIDTPPTPSQHPIWRRLRAHGGSVVLAVVVFAGVHIWQTRHIPSGSAPDLAFTLLAPDGSRSETTVTQWRKDHEGQAVAIHVWAEWCPICKAEAHNIDALLANQSVLTIAMQSGSADQVAKGLKQRQQAWPTAVDSRGELAKALGVNAVPAFLALDANGHIRGASVGYTSEWGMRWRLWWARLF